MEEGRSRTREGSNILETGNIKGKSENELVGRLDNNQKCRWS